MELNVIEMEEKQFQEEVQYFNCKLSEVIEQKMQGAQIRFYTMR